MTSTVRAGSGATRRSPADVAASRRADKAAERRDELAQATLVTLADLGYARTSLREIAANSEYSHGVLHYYFADKIDLITHCVRIYKARCVLRYDGLVDAASDAEELRREFADRLGESLVEDVAMHRLWYDLRSQSMFEAAFVTDVEAIDDSLSQMIWRVVSTYAALSGREPGADQGAAYAAFDGMFQQALIRHGHGDTEAVSSMVARAHDLLARLVD